MLQKLTEPNQFARVNHLRERASEMRVSSKELKDNNNRRSNYALG
jgi:hypothetical protein